MSDSQDEGKDRKRPPPGEDQNDALRRFEEFVKRILRVPKSEVSKDVSTSEDPHP